MKQLIYIVGMGPGEENMMTGQAIQALEQSDIIVGYTTYLDLLGERFAQKEKKTTGMRQEIERCKLCFEEAAKGKVVSMLCSGDAGVYGMAAPMLEIGKDYPECELVVIPGVTAACSGAAALGAPVNHDFCVISLSDLLTPWVVIEKRLQAAVQGDFVIVLYNPSSRKRSDYLQRACDIMLANGATEERACGFVENIGREETKVTCCNLGELREKQVNMFTTVFIGNTQSEIIANRLVTKRGYHL